jgi:hypothetical protein
MSRKSLARLAAASALASLLVVFIAGCQDDEPLTSVGGNDPAPVFTTSSSANPCFDGQVAHNSSNCSSCAGSDFTINTTSSVAEIKQDLGQTDLCGETNAVLYFDTSNLNNAQCGVLSATLSFHVKSVLSLDVDEIRVRVYSKALSGVCPTSLSSADFVSCGSGYTDLGTVTITGTGWVSFNIPNPSVNLHDFSDGHKHHTLKVVLVDDSDFSSSSGSQLTKIGTKEGTNKPKLDIVTYDCFQTCVDGTVVHEATTPCSNCDASEFTQSTTSQTYLSVFHYEPSSGGCARPEDAALMFDTGSINDGSTIATAKLHFNVSFTDYEGVNSPYVQVYAVSRSSCPSSLGSTDFPFCNSQLVSLGTVYIGGTGFHSLTISNPNTYVNKQGITEFVVVDASTISYLPGGSGSAWTVLSAAEDEARFRPRLEVRF